MTTCAENLGGLQLQVRFRRCLYSAPLAIAALGFPVAALSQATNLLEMSIAELSQIDVSTATRSTQNLNRVPASIHVITRDQIRRSGVRSIPEALRLAPGVAVARNSSSSWTISMRGFSSDLSNKLLVLIDGRSVYSPLYAGVFWDAQDVLLEDVDRIEVIAGPAGTLWGANAVNGVINIITRTAWETQGGFVQAGAGNEHKHFGAVRVGGMLKPDIAARAYIKQFERDATDGVGSDIDNWEMAQAGFRMDRELSQDVLTLQGDIYAGETGTMLREEFTLGTMPAMYPGVVDLGGGNLLALWTHSDESGASVRVQAYYDHTWRNIPGTYDERRDTFDLDLQHHLPLARHDLVWGLTLRSTRDDINNTTFATFTPASRRDSTYGVFIQDRMGFIDDSVFLTIGSKFEHNNYSGFEYQPNVRFTWLANDNHTVWAAVSRAVRIPARLNEDLELQAPIALENVPLLLVANVHSRDDFKTEELLASELGYRVSVRSNLSLDMTLFNHEYENLMTNEVQSPVVVPGPPPYLLVPIGQGNGMQGDSYGGTIAANWQLLPGVQLEFEYSHIQFDLELAHDSTDDNALNVEGNSPSHEAAVHSYVQLPNDLSLFAAIRYVDDLPNQDVSSYTAVDVSLDWQAAERLSTSVSIRNLTDDQHPEYGEGNEIERSAYLKLNWRF